MLTLSMISSHFSMCLVLMDLFTAALLLSYYFGESHFLKPSAEISDHVFITSWLLYVSLQPSQITIPYRKEEFSISFRWGRETKPNIFFIGM